MKFLKENWVLFVGFSLPLLLTLLFYISTQIALSSIDPPRYSVVFYEDQNYARDNDPYRLVVKGHQLYFQYFPLTEKNNNRKWTKPRLFIYNPVTGSKQEIELTSVDDPLIKVDQLVQGLPAKKLTTTKKSPDGYIFDKQYRGDGNLMTFIFGGSRSRGEVLLIKDSYSVEIPNVGRHATHFVGWLKDEED